MPRIPLRTPPRIPRTPAQAFLWGMAHAFDLGATLLPSAGELAGGPADDARAIGGDWRIAVRRAAAHGPRE